MNEITPAKRFGLLANGSTPNWEIAVDESLDEQHEWQMQIVGRHAETAFRLDDLGVVLRAIDYVKRGLESFANDPSQSVEGELTLGTFGDADVMLVWDVEDTLRLGLIANGSEGSRFRITFVEEDVKMLLDALLQVQAEL